MDSRILIDITYAIAGLDQEQSNQENSFYKTGQSAEGFFTFRECQTSHEISRELLSQRKKGDRLTSHRRPVGVPPLQMILLL